VVSGMLLTIRVIPFLTDIQDHVVSGVLLIKRVILFLTGVSFRTMWCLAYCSPNVTRGSQRISTRSSCTSHAMHGR